MSEISRVEQKETLFACVRFAMTDYSQVSARLLKLKEEVPANIVSGPPILVRHYVSSVREGTLVELGFPVKREFTSDKVLTRTIQRVECLSLKTTCSMEDIGESYRKLFKYADDAGIISDEYGIEILHELNELSNCLIEAMLVIHPWENLFRRNLVRTLGEQEAQRVFSSWDTLPCCNSVDRKFNEISESVARLDESAGEFTRYDCLSSCAHVFPMEQILKLKSVFQLTAARGGSMLDAVDAVITFMNGDPGWTEIAIRDGNVIRTAKGPRDPKAYAEALNPDDRAAAACFCPIIRNKLKEGMSPTFCYCGAGWYRQQWEGATGLPARVEVLKSLLKGDDECLFEVHLQMKKD